MPTANAAARTTSAPSAPLTLLIDVPSLGWPYVSEPSENVDVEQVLDVAPGLWIWRLAYPSWQEGAGWPELVTSTCVESGGEVAVLDPLAPPGGSVGLCRAAAKTAAHRLRA